MPSKLEKIEQSIETDVCFHNEIDMILHQAVLKFAIDLNFLSLELRFVVIEAALLQREEPANFSLELPVIMLDLPMRVSS